MKKRQGDVSLKCIVCDKEVEPVHPEMPDLVAHSSMWMDAVVDKLSAGYGSDFDMESFIVAVCDGCMKKRIEEGAVSSSFSPEIEVKNEV